MAIVVYTVTITPNPNSRGDVTFQIPENTVRDFALNFNRSSTETNAVRIDTVPPVAEIHGAANYNAERTF